MIRSYWLRRLLCLRPLCCFCERHPAAPGQNACPLCYERLMALLGEPAHK